MFRRIARSASQGVTVRLIHLWLAFFLSLGPTTLQAATYYVDSSGGSDANGGTSEGDAFKTIGHALSTTALNLDESDTIIVLPGLYDDSNGEDFPLALVDGVALTSRDGAAATTISAPDGVTVFLQTDTLGTDTRLEGFTLKHDQVENLTDIIMQFGEEGTTLSVQSTGAPTPDIPIGVSFEPTIRGNVFLGQPAMEEDQQGDIGIFATDASTFFGGTIENNTFSDFSSTLELYGYFGLFFGGSAGILIAPYLPTDERSAGPSVSMAGTRSPDLAPGPGIAPLIQHNFFHDNSAGVGIVAIEQEMAVFAPVIDANTFEDNQGDYVEFALVAAPQIAPVFSNNTSTNPEIGVIAFEAFYTFDDEIESQSEFRGNRVTEPGYFGLGVLSSPGSEHTVRIVSNTVADGAGGLYLGNAGPFGGGGLLQMDVENNTVTGNGVGLIFYGSNDGVALGLGIRGNVITSNQEFGAGLYFGDPVFPLAAAGGAAAVEEGASITENLIENNGDGLVVEVGDGTITPFFRCNAITNNEDDGVVVLSSTGPSPDFGTSLDAGNNSIFGNGGGSGTYDFHNQDPDGIDAQGNYWGTTNDTTIDSHIFDDDESAGASGAVDFSGDLSASTVDSCLALLIGDVDVTKSAPATAPAGSQFAYTITVTNNDSTTATNVVISDPLPPETTFVSATGGCTFSTGTVTCEIGELSPGQSVQRTITVQVANEAEGTFENTAFASADQADSDGDSSGSAGVTIGAAAAAAPIPTASEWGLIAMALLLSIAGLWVIRRGGMMATLLGALLTTAFLAADVHAAVRMQKAMLQSVTVQGDQVTLHFAGREPVTLPREALKIVDFRPLTADRGNRGQRPATSSSHRPFKNLLRLETTPEALATSLNSLKAGGQLVVIDSTKGTRLTLVASERQADRMITFHERIADHGAKRQ